MLENKVAQEVSNRVQAVENLNDRKVDKVDGKELSSNDFTDLLKAKLDNIQEFANYITKVSQLENDSNYQNAEQVEAAIQKLLVLHQKYLTLWERLLRLWEMILTLLLP